MKFAAERPWSDSAKAARKQPEIANDVEVVQDGRIYIELINGPFLFREGARLAEYKAGLDSAIEPGWLVLHESGTSVKFTAAGADLFAQGSQLASDVSDHRPDHPGANKGSPRSFPILRQP